MAANNTATAGRSLPEGLGARMRSAARFTTRSLDTSASYEDSHHGPDGANILDGMNRAGRGAVPVTTGTTAVAWQCADCGHDNVDRLTCESCGLARHYHEDPTLDLPTRPRLRDTAGFWLGSSWALAALAGGVLLLFPDLRERTGLGLWVIFPEVAVAGYAALSSFLAAVWERWF